MWYAPKGLCCPSRRSMIRRSPLGVVPEQYGGAMILQDSKSSLAVSASLDPSLFGDYAIIQMHLYAFDKATNCPGSVGSCQLSDFFLPASETPRAGNVFLQLATDVFPASGPFSMSSFHSLPVKKNAMTLSSSLGYEMVVCFVDRGTSVGASSETLYSRLYTPGSVQNCQFPTLFPARTSFD